MSHSLAHQPIRRNRICIGCAGGRNVKFTVTHKAQEADRWVDAKAVLLTLNKFVGGHTGGDIHLGRANPLHVSARLLAVVDPAAYRVAAVRCGTADNAIPRKCEVELHIQSARYDEVAKSVADEFARWKKEYASIEPTASLALDEMGEGSAAGKARPAMNLESSQQLVNFLNVFPFGPQRMSPVVDGLVETSLSMSIVSTAEDGAKTECIVSTRSSSSTQADMLINKLRSLASLAGVAVSEPYACYPGWDPAPVSPLRDLATKVYTEVYSKLAEERGEAPPVTGVYAIHAGLECGLIKEKYPEMDCISIGPTIDNPHSPDERLLIRSVDPFMDALLKVLAGLE